MKKDEVELGMMVRLKAYPQAPDMKVEKLVPYVRGSETVYRVWCIWFARQNDEMHRGDFAPEQLELSLVECDWCDGPDSYCVHCNDTGFVRPL